MFVCLGRKSSQTITSIVTSYGWDDNDPPSAQISYPKDDGYPTKHNSATEGRGTYDDPVTFATDKRELAIGTMIYIPFLQKYFIMEDDCGAAHGDWDRGHYHVDLWMGPQHESDQGKLNACEDKITRSAQSVIVNPTQDLPVDTTPLFTNNQCTARMHG